MDETVPSIVEINDEGINLNPGKPVKATKQEEPIKVESEPVYDMIFQQNRAFEMHYKGDVIRWEGPNVVHPEKYLQGFPKDFIESEEVRLLAKYFLIKKQGA